MMNARAGGGKKREKRGLESGERELKKKKDNCLSLLFFTKISMFALNHSMAPLQMSKINFLLYSDANLFLL